jgi:hypothetical protein
VWLTEAGRARREAAVAAAVAGLRASGVAPAEDETLALLGPLRALRRRLDAARDGAAGNAADRLVETEEGSEA